MLPRVGRRTQAQAHTQTCNTSKQAPAASDGKPLSSLRMSSTGYLLSSTHARFHEDNCSNHLEHARQHSQSLPFTQSRPGMKGLRMHSHVHQTATNRLDYSPDHSPVGALAHALQMQDCPTVMRPASRNVLAPRSSAVAKTSRTARRAPHPASGVKEHNCLLEALCSLG